MLQSPAIRCVLKPFQKMKKGGKCQNIQPWTKKISLFYAKINMVEIDQNE